MSFTTDKQTLNDLNIFDSHGGNSIYQVFNHCTTRGGAAILEDMFLHPLSDSEAINRRSGIFRYFAERPVSFPVMSAYFDAINVYHSNTDERTRLAVQEYSMGKRLNSMIAADAETVMIHKGIMATVELLQNTAAFIASKEIDGAVFYRAEKEAMETVLATPALASVLQHNNKAKPSQALMAEYDVIFRFRYREEIQKLMRYLYRLDVYLSVARVANERGFVFAEALPVGNSTLILEGVYHPGINKAVPNTIQITSNSNVFFLTGANMAGKSTFMKSLSIALYLAHMGFPVAATAMQFSVLDGIYTTINLPDNLGMGASHFYIEVLRLKKMAQELADGKKLFILFDELFRGTNVKDAYEATIAVTSAFAEKRDSIFVISTHIIEAGEILREKCDNIRFLYLPTRMNGNKPIYAYTLQQGITNDRHGMIIINNEQILQILENGLRRGYNATLQDTLTV